MTVQEGSIVGPYRLSRRLGGGGAGEVYLADPAPDSVASPSTTPERVAVKLIYGTQSDPTAQGIVRDAQIAGRLNQSHILPVHGVLAAEDRLAIVMAFAQGGSLGDNLRAHDPSGHPMLALPLEARVVARMVSQIAGALQTAHAAGISHGDLKPTNVFVRTSSHGRPLAALGDFGQAVLMSAATMTLARGPSDVAAERRDWAARQLLFAAPEQLRGVTTEATDQYGLAAVAYLLLTGSPPISGDSGDMLGLIDEGFILPPSHRNTTLPPGFDAALLRALAHDPSERFASMAEFAEAVRSSVANATATAITHQFAQLAGEGESQTRHPETQLAYQTGNASGRQTSASRLRSRLSRRVSSLGVPDTSPAINKRLAVITSVAILLCIVACVLASQAFSANGFLPHIILGNQTPVVDTPVIPTPNPTAQAQAQSGVRDLQLVLSHQPLFVDKMTSNSADWPTSGNTLYFAKDGYHISTFRASSMAGVSDTPGSHGNLADVAVKVNVQFAKGQPGNFGGVRLFVSQNGDKSESYYCFLVSIEGRYAVWEHNGNGTVRIPAWSFIASGYSNTLRTGLQQSNDLEVLAIGSGRLPRVILFANNKFITQIPLTGSQIPLVGGTGLIVFNDDTEVVFRNFALYDASSVAQSPLTYLG